MGPVPMPGSPAAWPGAYALPPVLSAGRGPPIPLPGGWPAGMRPPMPGMLPAQGILPGGLPASLQAPRPQQLLPAFTKDALSSLPIQAQRQHLGERLYQLIARYRPDFAGKITGMLLELDNAEIFTFLESEDKLKKKVQEAIFVLEKRR